MGNGRSGTGGRYCLPFWGLPLFPLLFDLVVADGMAGGFNQVGIHGYALLDGRNMIQTLLYVKQYLLVIMIYPEFPHTIFLRITHPKNEEGP
jgi:hypothetical protein